MDEGFRFLITRKKLHQELSFDRLFLMVKANMLKIKLDRVEKVK